MNIPFWVLIPLVAIVTSAVVQIAKLKYGDGKRIPKEMEGRVAQLESEMQAVREELGETQERLDFTERLLAKQKDTGKLGA